MIDTKALRELCERAAKGGWHLGYSHEVSFVNAGALCVAKFDGTNHANNAKSVYTIHNAAPELLDEIDALRVKEKWLGELLAVIHCDGGHYESEHGTENAVKEAMAVRNRLVVSNDVLREENETLRKHMDDCVAEQVEEAKADADYFDRDLWKSIRRWIEKQPGFSWTDYDDGMNVDEIITFLDENSNGLLADIAALRERLKELEWRE